MAERAPLTQAHHWSPCAVRCDCGQVEAISDPSDIHNVVVPFQRHHAAHGDGCDVFMFGEFILRSSVPLEGK